MPTLAEVRKQFPQYDDLSDAELLDGLYRSFYSDMPRDEFDARMGVESKGAARQALRENMDDESLMNAQRGEADFTARAARGKMRNYGLTDYTLSRIPFGDEAAAAGRASAEYLAGLVKGEDVDFGDRFAVARASEEAAADDYAEENPRAAMLGSAAALAASAGRAAPAAAPRTLVGRTIQSGGTGAALGGVEGFSEGDTLDERMQNAARGALAAGVGGAVAAPVIEGVAAGYRGLRRLVSPMTGAASRETEAARRVVDSLGGEGAALRAASVMDDAAEAGLPMIVADAGGEASRALARSARNTSSEAGEVLGAAVQTRFDDQADRVSSILRDITGATADTAALQERVRRIAQETNKKAYAKAYREGEAGAWDDELAIIVQAPVVQDAIKTAARTSANRAAIEGTAPLKIPFSIKKGETLQQEGGIPTLRFWDAVKRNLDDEIGSLRRQGRLSEASDAITLKSRIVAKMDELFPSYRDARRGAARFFDAEDAVEAGTKFVNSPMENAAAARAFNSMPEPEKQLFREAYVNEKLRQIGGMGQNRDVASSAKLFNSPQARERDRIVLGEAATRRLEALGSIERVMKMTKEAVQGGSTTVKQFIESSLAGGITGGVGAYLQTGGDLGSAGSIAALGAILGGMLRRTYNLVDQKTATRVGHMLASNDPETIRKAVRLIANNPRLGEGLRLLEARLGVLLAPAAASATAE